ncbi:FMN-linked oxidoreductase [Mycena maculata]|uniref:FMN-linked oxidoreductase n=1 Tax=Mycena maculata TaxID=230809 RepID=A0AAD7NA80_9AGAR|nr:FMN-linked oxidoreductase [Mycena maculata]
MATPTPKPALFQPIQIGDVQLRHRVVLAPSTRFRSSEAGVPSPIMAEYYAQRASVPGTLLIAEPAFIAQKAGGYKHLPGIWDEEHIRAWKQITDAVHAKGSFVFLQIWALGRCAYVEHLAPGDPFVSSLAKVLTTPIHRSGPPRPPDVPRAMTVPEIREYAQLFGEVAANAVKAGFDGVEQLRERHPDLAYLHVIEDPSVGAGGHDFIREIWGPRPLISAGGYSDDRESGFRAVEEKGDLIAYSRAFIANPDLPCRLLHDIPLTKGDGSKYYTYGSTDPAGYTDYAFHFASLKREVTV